MNPINVSIQKIEPSYKVPVNQAKILDLKIRGLTMQLLIETRTQIDPPMQALWDEKNDKFYLVGKISGPVWTGKSFRFPQSRKVWINIKLSPLGKRREIPIFVMKGSQLYDDGPGATIPPPYEELLLTVNLHNRKMNPLYPVKISPFHGLSGIGSAELTVLEHKFRDQSLHLLIETDEQAFKGYWDEINDKFYLEGGVEPFSSLRIQTKKWISIDLSSLGKTGKFDIWKIENASEQPQEALLMSVNIPRHSPRLAQA
jgi:hypothetical protein